MNPLKLERRPHTDQKRRFGAQQRGEDREKRRIKRRRKRGDCGEEESDLSEDEREPNAEKGARFEIEGIEDVGGHEAEGEGGDDGGAAEVEEEGGAWDECDCDASIVGEIGRVVSRVFESIGG